MTMHPPSVPLATLLACACAALAACQRASESADRTRVAFSGAMPPMDGSRLEATVVEVNYGRGESSEPHRHPCPVIGYVVEGTVRSQVQGEAEAVYQAGETFYEPPSGVHLVSGNASAKAPAKLLAYFMCDRKAPLSTPVADSAAGGR